MKNTSSKINPPPPPPRNHSTCKNIWQTERRLWSKTRKLTKMFFFLRYFFVSTEYCIVNKCYAVLAYLSMSNSRFFLQEKLYLLSYQRALKQEQEEIKQRIHVYWLYTSYIRDHPLFHLVSCPSQNSLTNKKKETSKEYSPARKQRKTDHSEAWVRNIFRARQNPVGTP